jgi:nucleotide-binding universal stress UspA family protein
VVEEWQHQQATAVEDAQAYLAVLADKLSAQVPVKTVVTYGDAATEILEAVRTHAADGIVMATHGRTGLGHLLHGSVPEAVLAHSWVPVLVVHARPGERVAPLFDPAAARIMVPLDGSALSEAALPIALDMLGPAGELMLVSVATPPHHVERGESGRVLAYLDQQEDGSKRDAYTYLRGIARRLQESQPDLQVALDVRIGEPAAGIVMATADRCGDLVVMATHGRTGVRRAAMGSVAGSVVRSGSVPVVLVRASTTRHLPAQVGEENHPVGRGVSSTTR